MGGIGDGEGEWKWICSWFFLLSMKLYSSSVDLFCVPAIEDLIFLFFHSATFLKTQLYYSFKKNTRIITSFACLKSLRALLPREQMTNS